MSNLTDQTSGAIVAPDGSLATRPTTILTADEAALLRRYKKFLHAHGIREAVYCSACWDGDRADGMKAFVRDHQILFECRCRMLFHEGQTY